MTRPGMRLRPLIGAAMGGAPSAGRRSSPRMRTDAVAFVTCCCVGPYPRARQPRARKVGILFTHQVSFPRGVSMSHIVSIETEIRDAAAVLAACERLGLPQPTSGTTRLFSGEVAGLAVQLSGWKYPVVCQLESGQLKYDDFSGIWGDRRELDRFLQSYAVEKARIEARRQGHMVTEQPLAD